MKLSRIDIDKLTQNIENYYNKNRITNLRTFNGTRQCSYVCPSLEEYVNQWLWDSCFHANVLSYINSEHAKEEIRSLLYAQQKDGFVPHMIAKKPGLNFQIFYNNPYISRITQSPVIADAVKEIYEKTKDKNFLIEILPKLKNYYLWLDKNRNRDKDGLCIIIHSEESGKDLSPEYDRFYRKLIKVPLLPPNILKLNYKLKDWDIEEIFKSRKFGVKDLTFNCIYAQNLGSLSYLFDQIDDNQNSLDFKNKQKITEKSILEKCWDDETGLFYSLDSTRDDERIKKSTVSSFMPLMFDSIDEERIGILFKELFNEKEFWTEYPIPIEPRSSYTGRLEIKFHNPSWRGRQSTESTNFFIFNALLDIAKRFPKYQDVCIEKSKYIVDKDFQVSITQDFPEFNNSETGKYMGARFFGWRALILPMIHRIKNS